MRTFMSRLIVRRTTPNLAANITVFTLSFWVTFLVSSIGSISSITRCLSVNFLVTSLVTFLVSSALMSLPVLGSILPPCWMPEKSSRLMMTRCSWDGNREA